MTPPKALAIAATLLIASLPATAQEPSASESKFTAHSNLVFLPTRVQSKKGETIYGLKPEDFIVEDNGVRQSVHVDEDPDSSGLSLWSPCSAAGPRRWNSTSSKVSAP
jgi:hypothetical protein